MRYIIDTTATLEKENPRVIPWEIKYTEKSHIV